jgi:hypothetical protein
MSKSDRRALIAGIHPDEEIDVDLAEDFIAGKKPRQITKVSVPQPKSSLQSIDPSPAQPPAPVPPAALETPPSVQAKASSHLTGVPRVAIGARVRTEIAGALKYASLDRQMKGIEPYAIYEIQEEALEFWLFKNGYLK